MEEKKKFKPGINLIVGLIILAIVIFIVIKLIIWNSSTTIVDTNVEEGAYDMENLDYYVYPNEEAIAEHGDDGINNILIFGDSFVNNLGAKHSVVNELRKKLDANIIDMSCDMCTCTSLYNIFQFGPDAYSLYHLATHFGKKECVAEYTAETSVFHDDKRHQAFIDNMLEYSYDDIDTVIIMYSLVDYYNMLPGQIVSDKCILGYYGALYNTITYLQENYPHLNIVISSPTLEYITGENGQDILASEKDYGHGNASTYINVLYTVATRSCVSYIDNYFYVINENNYKDYVNGFNLTDEGVDLVVNHMADFLNH